MLTGHQQLNLRRRFPQATIQAMDSRVALIFPDGSFAFGYLMVGKWFVSMSVSQDVPLPILAEVMNAVGELQRILC